MKITEVFTPKSSAINPKMYVARPQLESKLKRAIERDFHTLIYGESGNGKSWLYKKVLTEEGVPYKIVNLGTAARNGSISQEIFNVISPLDFYEKTGYSETKQTGISAGLNLGVKVEVGGNINHVGQYSIRSNDILLKAFNLFNEAYKDQRKFIILDNLEAIFNNENLMDELANIILLLDDERYSIYKVYFLLVGTPNGVLQYFRKTKNTESVSNRIKEMDEVGGLSIEQVQSIIENGLNLLGFIISEEELDFLIKHVFNVTLGIAQRVQEYGEQLAYAIEDNNNMYDRGLIKIADYEWLKDGLKECYQQIENNLNSINTEIARKNQVIYCIAKIEAHQFNSNDITSLIKEKFPETIPETNMGIGNILSELSKGDSPLIIKNNKVNSYSIKDPKYLMCIRIMLRKSYDGKKVEKLNFGQFAQRGLDFGDSE